MFFATFYADCPHEILPVTEGHRLCLVYNLIHRGSGLPPASVDNTNTVHTICSAIREWYDNEGYRSKFAYLLEHKYTPAGLSFNGLKNRDRVVAQLMLQVQQELQIGVFLGIVTKEESGDYDEVYDSSLRLEDCVGPDDRKLADMSEDIDRSEILQEDPFDDAEPDHESVEEATGNEGATVSRQYHAAALVFELPRDLPDEKPTGKVTAEKPKRKRGAATRGEGPRKQRK